MPKIQFESATKPPGHEMAYVTLYESESGVVQQSYIPVEVIKHQVPGLPPDQFHIFRHYIPDAVWMAVREHGLVEDPDRWVIEARLVVSSNLFQLVAHPAANECEEHADCTGPNRLVILARFG